MTLMPAWRQFRRARARFNLRWHERPGILLGGLRLILVALLDPRVSPGQARYLLNIGARACGCAVNPTAPK